MRHSIFVLALALSLSLLPGCVTRTAEILPVVIGYDVEDAQLAARLAPYVDGSGGAGNRKGYGRWKAQYESGNTFSAILTWNRHTLIAEVRVSRGRVNVRVLETRNLKQKGEKMHKAAVANMLALRATVAKAVVAERNLAKQRVGTTVAGVAPAPPRAVAPIPPAPPSRSAPPPTPAPRAMVRPMAATVAPTAVPQPAEIPAWQGIDFGNYYALVIGNNSYRSLPRLRTPVPDAAVVSSLLELDYGMDVQLLTDATRRQIVTALNEYRNRLDEDDNLLIYYAGHGWFDRAAERGYWLPIDARENDPSNWISNATISDMVRAIPAKHVMLIADSCYSGTLTRGIKMDPPGDRYLQGIAGKRARTVLTSGGLEPVEDGAGRHSVFAGAFISALRNNASVMDGQRLFSEIRRPVMLGADQTPEYGDIRRAGHDGGDFIFVRER